MRVARKLAVALMPRYSIHVSPRYLRQLRGLWFTLGAVVGAAVVFLVVQPLR